MWWLVSFTPSPHSFSQSVSILTLIAIARSSRYHPSRPTLPLDRARQARKNAGSIRRASPRYPLYAPSRARPEPVRLKCRPPLATRFASSRFLTSIYCARLHSKASHSVTDHTSFTDSTQSHFRHAQTCFSAHTHTKQRENELSCFAPLTPSSQHCQSAPRSGPPRRRT